LLNRGSGTDYAWIEKKEQRAIAVISHWLEKCDRRSYSSVSGGKDSLVVSHLIRRVMPDCPLVWVNQGRLAEWDDCIELLYYLKDRGWNVIELCPPRGLLQLYKDLGLPLEGTMDTKTDKLINQRLIHEPLEEYQEMHGSNGYAWGIRIDEGGGRKYYLKRHGELYQRKDNGLWVCSPIAYWKTEEVWHYIDRHSLPYPAMYDRDRRTVRNGPPIGTTGVNWGRLAELRLNHPNLFEEFAAIFPEIRQHV
jgi:3'-phosphoadenosine 5'-phosphosulfate sulfotransferase (PAPS reductase)/FAD synthetase